MADSEATGLRVSLVSHIWTKVSIEHVASKWGSVRCQLTSVMVRVWDRSVAIPFKLPSFHWQISARSPDWDSRFIFQIKLNDYSILNGICNVQTLTILCCSNKKITVLHFFKPNNYGTVCHNATTSTYCQNKGMPLDLGRVPFSSRYIILLLSAADPFHHFRWLVQSDES